MAEGTKSQRKVLGSRLIPDLTKTAAVEKKTKYWFGLLAGAPVDPVHIHGVTFAKIMEVVSIGPGGETIRNPMMGVCSGLTKEQVEGVIKGLPRCIFRFQNRVIGRRLSDGVTEDLAASEEIETIRVGHMIRIPTEDDIEVMKKAGTYQPYTPGPEDEPVANYIYLVRQDQRGTEFPQPVSEIGIEIPEE